MKQQWNVLPAWCKVIVYFLILWLATTLAGAVPLLNGFLFFLILSVIMSGLFLKWEGNTILSLGFLPTVRKDGIDFLKGLGTGIVMLIGAAALTLFLTKDSWAWNHHVDPVACILLFLACLWSAFVQEFVFRGYPFQVLLKKYKTWLAQLIIAIFFGLMHLHRTMPVMQMAEVMLTTGLGSVLFGLAYLKTKKLFLPIGIHMGWNYAQELIPRVMSNRQSGIIIITENHIKYSDFHTLVPYLVMVTVAIGILYSNGRQAGYRP
jgi:membrane protease YdiL (CAAX protease family)